MGMLPRARASSSHLVLGVFTFEVIAVEFIRIHRMTPVVCIQTNKNPRCCLVVSEVGVGE